VIVPIKGLRFKGQASRRAVVPGAEEFAPSVTGLWLPPERTFSSVLPDGRFRAEFARHMQFSVERDIRSGLILSVKTYRQQIDDQLIAIFGLNMPGSRPTSLGHYFVGSAGDLDARGWGVGIQQEIPGHLRGSVEYSVASTEWSDWSGMALVAFASRATLLRPQKEDVHDLQTSVEATIPQTATRIFARYRMNTAFSEPGTGDRGVFDSRFNVRVNQALPFLSFSNADWEMLVDVRNLFTQAYRRRPARQVLVQRGGSLQELQLDLSPNTATPLPAPPHASQSKILYSGYMNMDPAVTPSPKSLF
jgi:hypothetical protein